MNLKTSLLAGTALLALASPAFAQSNNAIIKRLDALQNTIETQQKEINDQKDEIVELKKELSAKSDVAAAPPPPPAVAPAVVQHQQEEIDALNAKVDTNANQDKIAKQDLPVWSFTGGRPTIQSPDGRFSLALRGLGQFDTGYYSQGGNANRLIFPAANGPQLSNGSNFRRAYLGFQGKAFGDFTYYFNYDFGSSKGNEQQGRIQSLYAEYDGLAPWALRIGAFAPSANLEDATAPADTIFLERNSPSDVARNIAGGDGRDAIAVLYTGDRIFGSLALTGGKVADTTVYFDEQSALLGRVAGLVYTDPDTNILLSANDTYVLNGPNLAAGPGSARNITLSDPPELTFDDNALNLVSTGALNTQHLNEWGIEGAAQFRNFYGQAGYFGYWIQQRPTTTSLPDLNFDGWYVQGSWILTGETRLYSAATGSFTSPRPREPFSFSGGGWGAWEVAARYSDLNLNDNEGTYGHTLPTGGIRGGDQRIASFGINWYPNTQIKFMADYEYIDVSRIGNIAAVSGTGGHPAFNNTDLGQTINAFAFRSQVQF